MIILNLKVLFLFFLRLGLLFRKFLSKRMLPVGMNANWNHAPSGSSHVTFRLILVDYCQNPDIIYSVSGSRPGTETPALQMTDFSPCTHWGQGEFGWELRLFPFLT